MAEYNGFIAGYVNVYPFSLNGVFRGEGYSEIIDLKVLKKYKNHGFESKLMDVAEKIASNYSETAYTSVDVHDWQSLDFYIKRGFSPHQSGVWHKREIDYNSEGESKDKLVLWFSKKIIFPIINTIQYPYLRWLQEGLKTALAAVNTERCQRIKIGDEIILTDRQNIAYVKGFVTFRHEYATIREMLKSEGVKNIIPFLNDDDLEKGVQMYQNLPEFFSAKKYGCVAFGLRIVESKL